MSSGRLEIIVTAVSRLHYCPCPLRTAKGWVITGFWSPWGDSGRAWMILWENKPKLSACFKVVFFVRLCSRQTRVHVLTTILTPYKPHSSQSSTPPRLNVAVPSVYRWQCHCCQLPWHRGSRKADCHDAEMNGDRKCWLCDIRKPHKTKHKWNM